MALRLTSNLLNSVKVVNLGRIPYTEGLRQQKLYTDLVRQSKDSQQSSNFLLCLEHTPVYTVGIRSKLYSIEEEQRLQKLGADFHRTSRGGLITFHGPGQLVVYPILDLRRFSPRKMGVRLFVDGLEQSVIDCVRNDFGISDVGRSDKNTGVWVSDNRKLCAMGISVQHGVTGHGLAINCNTDLRWFEHVVACGIEGAVSTSLSFECSRNIETRDTVPCLVRRFSDVFECEIENFEDCEDFRIDEQIAQAEA